MSLEKPLCKANDGHFIGIQMCQMDVKDQFMGVLAQLNESQIEHLLIYAKNTFVPTTKSWDDIDEDDPTDGEVAAYQRFIAAKLVELPFSNANTR